MLLQFYSPCQSVYTCVIMAHIGPGDINLGFEMSFLIIKYIFILYWDLLTLFKQILCRETTDPLYLQLSTSIIMHHIVILNLGMKHVSKYFSHYFFSHILSGSLSMLNVSAVKRLLYLIFFIQCSSFAIHHIIFASLMT